MSPNVALELGAYEDLRRPKQKQIGVKKTESKTLMAKGNKKEN